MRRIMIYTVSPLSSCTFRWLIHDRRTAHAAIIDPKSVRSDDEIDWVVNWLAKQTSQNLADRRLGEC